MSLTPSKVPWDSNRLKAHEWVINYDSNGNAVLGKKEADYTKVKYNFASLPSNTSTTSQTQTGTTAQSGTTTQQQTSEAFGNVKPHYWTDDKPDDKTDEQEVMPWDENYEKQPDLDRPPVEDYFPIGADILTDPTTVNAKKSNISMAKKIEIEDAIQKLLQLRNMPNADVEALDFNINLLQQELIKRSKS